MLFGFRFPFTDLFLQIIRDFSVICRHDVVKGTVITDRLLVFDHDDFVLLA